MNAQKNAKSFFVLSFQVREKREWIFPVQSGCCLLTRKESSRTILKEMGE